MAASWRFCILALAALGSACAGTPKPSPHPSSDPAATGQAFVAQACAGCHAVGRSGDSPNPHAPKFRDLARSRADAELRATLAAIVRDGHVEMPPIYMTPNEQAGVVAYLRGLTALRT